MHQLPLKRSSVKPALLAHAQLWYSQGDAALPVVEGSRELSTTLNCRTALCRPNSGGKLMQALVSRPRSSAYCIQRYCTIKSRVDADTSTKYRGPAVMALQNVLSKKRFSPELRVCDETTLQQGLQGWFSFYERDFTHGKVLIPMHI